MARPYRIQVIGAGIWAWAGEPMARPYGFRGYWGWDMGVGGRADGSPLRVSRLLGLGYGRGRAGRWLAPTEVIGVGIWAWAGEPRLAPTGFRRLLGLRYGRGRASRWLAPTGFVGYWGWDMGVGGRAKARPYRIRGYWGWDMGVGVRADGSPLQDSRLLGLGYGRGRASRWLAPTGFEVIGVGIWAWAGEPQARPYRIRGYWGWDMGVGGRADGSPLRVSRLLGLGYGRGRASRWLAPTGFEVIRAGIWAWAGEPMARPYRIRGYWGWDMGVGGRADGSPLQDSRLLGMGCGRGWASRWHAPTGFEVIGDGVWTWAGEPMARPYRIRGYWGWDMGEGGRAEGSPLQDSRLLGLGYGRGRASRWLAPTGFEVIRVGIWAWAGEPRLAPTGFAVVGDGVWAWVGDSQSRPYRFEVVWGFEVIGVLKLLVLACGSGRASVRRTEFGDVGVGEISHRDTEGTEGCELVARCWARKQNAWCEGGRRNRHS